MSLFVRVEYSVGEGIEEKISTSLVGLAKKVSTSAELTTVEKLAEHTHKVFSLKDGLKEYIKNYVLPMSVVGGGLLAIAYASQRQDMIVPTLAAIAIAGIAPAPIGALVGYEFNRDAKKALDYIRRRKLGLIGI